jgi:microcin C transport system permease protein
MIENFLKHDLSKKRWRRFKARKLAMISLIALLFFTLLTFIAPIIANSRPLVLKYDGKIYFPVMVDYSVKEFGIEDAMVVDYRSLDIKSHGFALWPPIQWDPFESNNKVESFPSKPTSINLFGTDDRGRDVFTRLLYGYKYSILYAILVWFISFSIGTTLGGTMGYFGGKIDFLGQRCVEVLSTVPQFFLLIILISIFKPSLLMLITISSMFGWISISYYIRGEFLKNRNKDYVEAARSVGASDFSIIFKHILPNSMSPIITYTPFVIAGHIVGLASLDYLGFGLEVPTPSWGELLAQAQKYFTIAWWLAVYPSACLFGVLTMLSLVGEAVRDAMDPNMN